MSALTSSETAAHSFDVYAADSFDLEWFSETVGVNLTITARGIKGVEDGVIQMMVVFDQQTHTTATLHIYVRHCLRSYFLRQVFWHAFEVCKYKFLLGVVPADRKSVPLALKLGFTELYRIEDGWMEGVPMLVLRLLPQDCRWL